MIGFYDSYCYILIAKIKIGLKNNLDVRKTISDSKAFFHNDFPYVIPSIYRKIVDEFLVELNLLSNQSSGVTGEIHYVDNGYNIIGMIKPPEKA